MRKLTLSLTLLGTMLVPLLPATPAQAQATRTWVSGVGDDANPCSRTAPCKTFAGAISKTFINGEINCLDPGGFGTINITKSITIDCHEIFASILASGVNGVIVNIGVNANDPLRTARLRNININGAGASGSVGTRTGINGIRIISALNVFLDDMLVTTFSQKGILDERTAAGKLFIRNSIMRDNGQAGVHVVPSAGSATIDVVIDNSHSIGNAGAGLVMSNGPRVVVKRSVFSGNSFGVDVEGNLSASQLVMDDSVVSGNGTGFFQSGSGNIRMSNTDIAFNTALGSGQLNTFTNNRLTGNGAGGTLVTVAPAGTNPSGQQ